MDVKKQIISELDSRIDKLENNPAKKEPAEDNQFAQLNHAVSHIIGDALKKEIQDIRSYVQEL